MTQTMPLSGGIFITAVGLAVVDPLAKFKECSFIHSRNIEGGLRGNLNAGPRAWNKLPPPLRCVSSVDLRHFYTITLLIHIVRRPCCVSALTSP